MNDHSGFLKLEVIKTRRDGRRRFSEASKRRLIEACLKPDVSISDMAARHDLNVNLLYRWIERYRAEHGAGAAQEGIALGMTEGQASPFVPVEIVGRASEPTSPKSVPPSMLRSREMPTSKSVPPASASRLTVALPNGVKLELECGGQDAGLLAALIETLGRCDVPSGR